MGNKILTSEAGSSWRTIKMSMPDNSDLRQIIMAFCMVSISDTCFDRHFSEIIFSRFRFYFRQCRLFGAFQQWFHGSSDEDMSKQTAVLLVFQGSHQDVKMILHSQMFY